MNAQYYFPDNVKMSVSIFLYAEISFMYSAESRTDSHFPAQLPGIQNLNLKLKQLAWNFILIYLFWLNS